MATPPHHAPPDTEPHIHEVPEQEDPLNEDLPGNNSTQGNPFLPLTQVGDFPSDEDPVQSNDSFKTIKQPSPRPYVHSPDSFSLTRKPFIDQTASTSFQPPVASTPMVPTNTGARPKTPRYGIRIASGASASADNTPKLARHNIRGTVSAEHTPRPATRAQHKKMGTVVADPTYLPTTVEYMARKEQARAAAEHRSAAAAAAADPYQPAPGNLDRLTDFASQTQDWEARHKTRREKLFEALHDKDKRRNKNKDNTD